jgi:hypothetical protein
MVSEYFIRRIKRFLDKSIRTTLYATEAVLTDSVKGFEHLAGIDTSFFVDVIHAILLHAAGAFETPFLPCDDP